MAPKKSKSGGGGSSGSGRRCGGGNKKKSVVKHTSVKNIKGTSKKANQISNLKRKYKKATGTKRKTCAVKGCKKEWTDTAHVQQKSRKDKSWQVAPLCRPHNQTDKKMKVESKSMLP